MPILPVTHFSVVAERDLFGAEPFDPFSCGAGDFPPDIQSKLDEMQVTTALQTWILMAVCLFFKCMLTVF